MGRNPGTQAVKGLIPERRGQAYRPARISGIKGRAEPITEEDLAADPEDRADQRDGPREDRHKAKDGTTEERGPEPSRAGRRGASPRVGKPTRMPKPELVAAPVPGIRDRRSGRSRMGPIPQGRMGSQPPRGWSETYDPGRGRPRGSLADRM